MCRTVTLRLLFDDFSRASRSHTLPEATAETNAILATARGLFATAVPTIRARGITLLGLTLSDLHDGSAIQLALPFGRRGMHDLEATLDDVRERFGSSAVTRAVLLGRDHGVAQGLRNVRERHEDPALDVQLGEDLVVVVVDLRAGQRLERLERGD